MKQSEVSELESYIPKSCKHPVLVVLACQPGGTAAARPEPCMNARERFIQRGTDLGSIDTRPYVATAE